MLLSVSLAPFRRDPALRAIHAAFRETGDVLALAEQLEAFAVENGLSREIAEPTALGEVSEQDLQLVCYELLTAGS